MDQREAAAIIYRSIMEATGGDFDTAVLEATMLEGTNEMCVILAKGTALTRITVPCEARRCLSELRADMAIHEGGTWYSAHFILNRGGGYQSGFDYDSRPQWELALDPASEREMILEDLQRFPRTDEAIPDWLRELRNRPA